MAQFDRIPEFFLQNFLSKPVTALPKGAQWVVLFESFPVVAIKSAAAMDPKGWNIDKALESITGNGVVQNQRGCLFAQAISVPGESIITNPEGLLQNSFLRTMVGQGRDSSQMVRISFLDTNISFVENVVRPWVLATGRYGMVARDDGDPKNYRTNLILYKLGCHSADQPPFPVMKMNFLGVCPTAVSEEEYNYTQISAPTIRGTDFIFNSYTIDTEEGNYILANPTETDVPLSTKTRGRNVKR